MQKSSLLLLGLLPLFFSGCETVEMRSNTEAQTAMRAAIAAETPGDYFIGRRYYKRDYKFWGWVRRPQQPWSTAQMVMMNEQEKLAPDRAQNTIGSDNNYEYKLYGNFSGQTVYEPASNGFYPEFVLKSYEMISVSPVNIYKEPGATDPARRVIAKPQ
jgi:hypothetical protein